MNSNSYGVREVPADMGFGVYDPNNGEWVGQWFGERETAMAYVNDPENGFDVYGDSPEGWYVVSTAEGAEDDVIYPTTPVEANEPDSDDWAIGDPLGNEVDIITDDDDGIHKPAKF